MKNEVANVVIALIACLALGELLIAWLQGKRTHTLRESISSISMGIGQQAIGVYVAGGLVLLYAAVETRVGLFDFRMDTWWHWPLLFLLSDFCYYWAHRTSHTRNFWVAGHIPHHHSEEFNLISSFRQGWTAWIVNSMFFLPLPLLGFPIEMTGLGQAAILVVQFLAHNGLIERKLGPLEWVFITPANHRVHHGLNEPYLGANCGGMFCIWDRVFGTYQQATPDNPIQLGVSMPLDFYDPIEANLDYYRRLVFVSRHRKGLGKLAIWFSTPEVLLDECERFGFQPVRLLDRQQYDARRALILVGITLALVAAFGVHRVAYEGNPWPLRLATGALVAAILYAAGRAMAGPSLQGQLGVSVVGAVFGLLFVTMMSALWLEFRYSRRHGLDWHVPGDTLANLNLAGGRLALGILGSGVLLMIYGWFAQRPLVQLDQLLPTWAFWLLGLLLTELVQYWTHRLAHRWHWLGWAHLTHHSSSRLNLSTSMRISWIYRYYIWFAYLPLALLGYGVLEFVAFQGLLNGYNQFMHTRARVPYGPLEYVLISPAAHRLHHVRDPALAGNYGAMFSLYDRLFGTWRQLDDPATEPSLAYGMHANHDTADLIALNFAPLRDRPVDSGLGEVSGLAWVLLVPYALVVMAGVTQQARLPLGGQLALALLGIGLAAAYAHALNGPLRRTA